MRRDLTEWAPLPRVAEETGVRVVRTMRREVRVLSMVRDYLLAERAREA